MKTRLFVYLLLLSASIIWGIAGPLLKYSFQFITPFEFLFWRFLLAVIITTPILIWYIKKHPLKSGEYFKLAILGLLCSTVNLSLVFLGLEKTSVVEASLIGSLTPMMAVIASGIFLHERIPAKLRLGLILAILGSFVTVLKPLLLNQTTGSSFEGNLLIFLSGIAWVGFVVLSKKWERNSLKPFHIVGFSFYIGLISFLLINLYLGKNSFSVLDIPSQTLLPIAYMAVFSSLIAYSAYEYALSKINASQADLFGYLSAVWAIPLSVYWLGEKITFFHIISAVLIVVGIFLAEYRPGIFSIHKPKGHHYSHHK